MGQLELLLCFFTLLHHISSVNYGNVHALDWSVPLVPPQYHMIHIQSSTTSHHPDAYSANCLALERQRISPDQVENLTAILSQCYQRRTAVTRELERHHRLSKYSHHRWSSANVELLQAILKVTILVMLKIIVKYYLRDRVKSVVSSETVIEALDLLAKAATIGIAKIIIKWSLLSALRTASKTLIIATLKSTLKPLTSGLVKSAKGDPNRSHVRNLTRFLLRLAVKVSIKTIALLLLLLVFEHDEMRWTMSQLMFRVSLIITVKMSAKKLCKLVTKSSSSSKSMPSSSSLECDLEEENSVPVDKIMMFAVQKLVTKLVKLPLIKILL